MNMSGEVTQIDPKTSDAYFRNKVFATTLTWYAADAYLPEPNDPVLLAITDFESGNMIFVTGYCEWDSPYITKKIHALTDEITDNLSVDWYLEDEKYEIDLKQGLVAFTPLIDIWQSMCPSIKVRSSYKGTTTDEICSSDKLLGDIDIDDESLRKVILLNDVALALSPKQEDTTITVFITTASANSQHRATKVDIGLSKEHKDDLLLQIDSFVQIIASLGLDTITPDSGTDSARINDFSGTIGEA